MATLTEKQIKKYTNLRVGDSVSSTFTKAASGIVGGFEEDNGKLYLTLSRSSHDSLHKGITPFYEVCNWKRIATPAKKISDYQFNTNFTMNEFCNDYDMYKLAADRTNKILNKPSAIRISEKATNIMGYPISEHGSVWYCCSTDELQIFHEQCIIAEREKNVAALEKEYNIRRATKIEIQVLNRLEKYYMVYVNQKGHSVECVECAKLEISGWEGEIIHLLWHEISDQNKDVCGQEWDMVNEDGSFIPSHGSQGNEIGYFYIENRNK